MKNLMETLQKIQELDPFVQIIQFQFEISYHNVISLTFQVSSID